jgi:poly(A) polymerase Pap1
MHFSEIFVNANLIKHIQNRMVVLAKLNEIFKNFVKKVSIKNNLPESIANEAGGKVFSFGSYRLGVHGKGNFYWSFCWRVVSMILVNFGMIGGWLGWNPQR